jgi:hypothetical protein
MNVAYTAASKDWWQKHSDELKVWDWDSFCKVWEAAIDSKTSSTISEKQFRFLKDVKIMGVVHSWGEVHTLDKYDRQTDTEIKWCIGHGCRFPLVIGEDVEFI